MSFSQPAPKFDGKTVTPGFNAGAQPGEVKSGVPGAPGAPAILKHERGDSESKALAAFYKSRRPRRGY